MDKKLFAKILAMVLISTMVECFYLYLSTGQRKLPFKFWMVPDIKGL